MTDPSLREFLQAQIDAVEKRLCQKITAQEKVTGQALSNSKEAVVKAENAMGERLALLNESRRTIADQSATFIPRAEYTIGLRELSSRLNMVEKSLARSAGQQSVWVAIGLAALALFGVAVEFVGKVPLR